MIGLAQAPTYDEIVDTISKCPSMLLLDALKRRKGVTVSAIFTTPNKQGLGDIEYHLEPGEYFIKITEEK